MKTKGVEGDANSEGFQGKDNMCSFSANKPMHRMQAVYPTKEKGFPGRCCFLAHTSAIGLLHCKENITKERDEYMLQGGTELQLKRLKADSGRKQMALG